MVDLVQCAGDLHDGTGLVDSYSPDGEKALPIFDQVDYDLLTIGKWHASYLCLDASANLDSG
jgi:2',3'-cyclic-nucleotide 2'-phosphodiesterase (5'-nucleotidase family)